MRTRASADTSPTGGSLNRHLGLKGARPRRGTPSSPEEQGPTTHRVVWLGPTCTKEPRTPRLLQRCRGWSQKPSGTPARPAPRARPAPLGDRCEVGEHVSGHHVQTRFRELQVEIFQVVISLGHRILVCRPQAGTCERRLDPAGGRGPGEVRDWPGRLISHRGPKLKACKCWEGRAHKPPTRAHGQSSHCMANHVDTSSQREEWQGLTGETQAHSSEQRLRRQGRDRRPLTEAQES